MLKKSITYDDYNGNTVTKEFLFNFTKLELLETDLQYGGLEATIERLTATENTKEAYDIFKELILAAYGEKSEDGQRFIKTDELRTAFEQSPALSEMIIEFLGDPQTGASFIEGTLPARLVAEVKAAQAAAEAQKPTVVELPTAEPVLEGVAEGPKREKTFNDYSREELVRMPQDEYERLVPKDPKDQSHVQLQVSYERKFKQ